MQIRTFVLGAVILGALVARHAASSRPVTAVVRRPVLREAWIPLPVTPPRHARPVRASDGLRDLAADLDDAAAAEADRIAREESEALEIVGGRVTQHDTEIDPEAPGPETALEVPSNSFTGCHTSQENRYYVDGIDVTGLSFGDDEP